jgi:hypothetical protein
MSFKNIDNLPLSHTTSGSIAKSFKLREVAKIVGLEFVDA